MWSSKEKVIIEKIDYFFKGSKGHFWVMATAAEIQADFMEDEMETEEKSQDSHGERPCYINII